MANTGYQVEVKKAFQQIELGVKNVFESENYKKYLKTMSKFHRYSINNSLLIMIQFPNATQVTGASIWNTMGRSILKGSKAIKILIPHPYKKEIEIDGELVEKDFCYFTLGNVFDVSQTTGEELPTICNELEDNSPEILSLIEKVSSISTYPINYWNLKNGSKGYFSTKDNKIVIKKGMSSSQTMKTLVHEIAHSRLHASTTISRQQAEIEAESIAFVVCNHFNVNTSDYSFEYIANWSNGKDASELKAILTNIQKEAKTIINEIEVVDLKGEE